MPAVLECGATLVRKLAETGTGNNKLDPCRQRLKDIFLRDNKRVASADEIMEVLEKTAPEGTILKAKTIVQTGEWNGPPNEIAVPFEIQVLGDAAVAEWRLLQEKQREDAVAKVEAELPRAPGIHPTPAQSEDTIGPKRVKK